MVRCFTVVFPSCCCISHGLIAPAVLAMGRISHAQRHQRQLKEIALHGAVTAFKQMTPEQQVKFDKWQDLANQFSTKDVKLTRQTVRRHSLAGVKPEHKQALLSREQEAAFVRTIQAHYDAGRPLSVKELRHRLTKFCKDAGILLKGKDKALGKHYINRLLARHQLKSSTAHMLEKQRLTSLPESVRFCFVASFAVSLRS